MRIGITAWIMVAVLSDAGSAFAQEPAAPPSTIPSEQGMASPSVLGTGKAPSLSGCRMRPYREDPMRAPFLLIEEGPIPGSDPDRPAWGASAGSDQRAREDRGGQFYPHNPGAVLQAGLAARGSSVGSFVMTEACSGGRSPVRRRCTAW